jgi:hypothetical protein
MIEYRMNRLSITRKLHVFLLKHPKIVRRLPKTLVLPKGYRKIVKK